MTSEDLSKFASFGISPDLLLEAGVRRVSDAEARNEYGIRFSAGADLSGLVFPYFDPKTGKRVTARVRRDRPEMDLDGKLLNKYLSPMAIADTCTSRQEQKSFSTILPFRHRGRSGEVCACSDSSWTPDRIIRSSPSDVAVAGVGAVEWERRSPSMDLRWTKKGHSPISTSYAGKTAMSSSALMPMRATNAKVRQARHELATELSARGGCIRVAGASF